MIDWLVVGYGSDLRGDDRAGLVVADRIEQEDLQGVAVRSVPQLAPELALDITRAERVVFVDADVDCGAVEIRPVRAGASGQRTMSHHGDPATMLQLAADLGRIPSSAYVVSIPAHDLALGFDLSPRTAAAVEEAVVAVLELMTAVRQERQLP